LAAVLLVEKIVSLDDPNKATASRDHRQEVVEFLAQSALPRDQRDADNLVLEL
jgi:hypothetical protein